MQQRTQQDFALIERGIAEYAGTLAPIAGAATREVLTQALRRIAGDLNDALANSLANGQQGADDDDATDT